MLAWPSSGIVLCHIAEPKSAEAALEEVLVDTSAIHEPLEAEAQRHMAIVGEKVKAACGSLPL